MESNAITASTGSIAGASLPLQAVRGEMSTCRETSNTPATTPLSGWDKLDMPSTEHLEFERKRILFTHTFGSQEIESVVRLCQQWHTSDLESVMTIRDILISFFSPEDIEKMKADQILLHCYANKKQVKPEGGKLTNSQQPGISIANFHQPVITRQRALPKRMDTSALPNGGIHFLVSYEKKISPNSYKSHGGIEVCCKLQDILDTGGLVHRVTDTNLLNVVFVVLPKYATIPFTILQRAESMTAKS